MILVLLIILTINIFKTFANTRQVNNNHYNIEENTQVLNEQNVENNIEEKFKEQNIEFENIEKYMNKWKENFNNKNFEGMEQEYIKIKEILDNLVPIEKTINKARTIENLHNLIKNNGQDFNLNKEQLALAEKLI